MISYKFLQYKQRFRIQKMTLQSYQHQARINRVGRESWGPILCIFVQSIWRLVIINKFENMKSSKKGKTIYRYNKITQQKKFHLLNLVLGEKMLIKKAATIVGINYSTAKTIMFFNRNGDKSYHFEFQKASPQPLRPPLLQSCVLDVSVKQEEGESRPFPWNPIEIVSTIGSKLESLQKQKVQINPSFSNSLSHLISLSNKHSLPMPFSLKQDENLGLKGEPSISGDRRITRSHAVHLKLQGTCKVQEKEKEQFGSLPNYNINYR